MRYGGKWVVCPNENIQSTTSQIIPQVQEHDGPEDVVPSALCIDNSDTPSVYHSSDLPNDNQQSVKETLYQFSRNRKKSAYNHRTD